MDIPKSLAALILEEFVKQGLQVKPFSTDTTGGKGYSCSAFTRGDDTVELTIGDKPGQFKPAINVTINFHRVKDAAPKAARMNTLPATLRVGALVDKLKAGE
jgi:hypothetical protein